MFGCSLNKDRGAVGQRNTSGKLCLLNTADRVAWLKSWKCGSNLSVCNLGVGVDSLHVVSKVIHGVVLSNELDIGGKNAANDFLRRCVEESICPDLCMRAIFNFPLPNLDALAVYLEVPALVVGGNFSDIFCELRRGEELCALVGFLRVDFEPVHGAKGDLPRFDEVSVGLDARDDLDRRPGLRGPGRARALHVRDSRGRSVTRIKSVTRSIASLAPPMRCA